MRLKAAITYKTRDKLNFSFDYNNEETQELNKILNFNMEFSIHDLRRIALWKLNRVLNIPEDLLLSLKEVLSESDLSIKDPRIKKLVDELLKCSGIGMPMASSFLKFLRPDIFPIIDVRAYRALFGKKLYYQSYNFDRYLEYAMRVYEIRDYFNIPLVEVDQQLYCFDREHNGKI